MKFYIASRLENYTQVGVLAEKLKAAGWAHTYDWTGDFPKQGSVGSMDAQALRHIAERELKGVSDADAVIVLTPQGRGTHTELGMAIALRKTVFLCHSDDTYFKCDGNETCFYFLPQVKRIVGTTEEIAEKILGYMDQAE